jgi:hypothetical protein
MRPAALLLPAIFVLVAACAATSPASPSPTPIASASAQPSTPAVTPAPSPTVAPSPAVTPAPTPKPTDAMTAAERKLVALLRPDAAVDCAPRRTDLPEGAIRAVECRADDPLVASIGVYEFKSDEEAAHAYMTRLASYGVDVRAGDCGHDVPGDAAWVPGDGEGSYDDPGVFNFENEALRTDRIGCFKNENGIANVRVTCDTAYIGVLGAKKDLSDLTDWTWRYPKGYEPGTPDAPGICVSGS